MTGREYAAALVERCKAEGWTTHYVPGGPVCVYLRGGWALVRCLYSPILDELSGPVTADVQRLHDVMTELGLGAFEPSPPAPQPPSPPNYRSPWE